MKCYTYKTKILLAFMHMLILSNNKREQSSNWTVIIVWNLIELYNGEPS